MIKQKESLVQIVLKYEDGTEKEINKGAVITLGEVDENGDTDLILQFANCKGKDLTTIVWGVLNMANETGILDEIAGDIKNV
ncbi:hypothetical protein G8V07_14595 [Clostridium botulinum D/C]|uniref:hypothetical protein n=1 Tax=Clostridium botulinum TaxID=1491 RepID=UPI001E625745|nr:hypothetical protein [Clostridium botulinum]MCD3321672.1 hypothetical protein [Clostridium botulinum D/C]MCD3324952.1 hypothetical protein [Clostridium botulinum D/C]MCD3327730.1 hypothetical protein [Clostridium botulinum D/C]